MEQKVILSKYVVNRLNELYDEAISNDIFDESEDKERFFSDYINLILEQNL